MLSEDDTAERIMKALAGVQDAINSHVSPAVQHQVDEALNMPAVGAVSRALDPIEQAIRDAIESALPKAE